MELDDALRDTQTKLQGQLAQEIIGLVVFWVRARTEFALFQLPLQEACSERTEEAAQERVLYGAQRLLLEVSSDLAGARCAALADKPGSQDDEGFRLSRPWRRVRSCCYLI
jgi:hypothetical protein